MKALFLLIPMVSLGCGGSSGSTATSNSCDLPDCLAQLISGFEPVGPCTYEATTQGNTDTTAMCYANGSKSVFSSDSTTPAPGQASTTKQMFWKGAALLFSVEATSVNDGSAPASFIYRDSSGREVGSATMGVQSSQLIVTCAGGAPTAVDAACWLSKLIGPLDDAGVGTQTCTQETCAP